jgi:hypothetical protein
LIKLTQFAVRVAKIPERIDVIWVKLERSAVRGYGCLRPAQVLKGSA